MIRKIKFMVSICSDFFFTLTNPSPNNERVKMTLYNVHALSTQYNENLIFDQTFNKVIGYESIDVFLSIS